MKAFVFLFVLLVPMLSFAAPQCKVDKLASFTWGNPNADNLVHVDADAAKVTPKQVTFNGNVIAKRGQEIFYADVVNYQRVDEEISTDTPLTYGRPDFVIRSEKANYTFNESTGQFESSEYYLAKQQALGQAETLQVDRNQNTEDLTEATYTTCERANPKWHMEAKELHIDHNTEIGEAWHSTFHIGDMPVLYLPYFNFALNDARKTGFLFPSMATSESSGFETTIPFYINIAPHQDVTLYPRLMSKRGFMLGAEYRYLHTLGGGIFSGNYLYKDLKKGTKRWSFKTEHTYRPTEKLTISMDYQRVSDTDYIEDLTDTLDLSSSSFLKSYLKADYRFSPNYRLSAEITDYQIADSDYTIDDKPYSLTPRVIGTGQWNLGQGFSFSSDTEAAKFEKEDTVSGWRFNQTAALAYHYENAYSFIKPEAMYRFTAYDLKRQTEGEADSITRAIPTFSLDSGLVFERQMTWFGKSTTQTLEPRLFYLYTPYRDQSEIPDFDTAAVSSSYSAMFLNNRFTGKDRIGDANQLTTAISTSLTDNDSGTELAKLSIGQIQYFQDRRVSLYDTVSDSTRSNVIAEGYANITPEIKVSGLIHYDIDTKNIEKSSLKVTYTPDIDKSISLSHLYDEDSYKQLDIAGVWRIDDSWRTFWRWNYSIQYNKSIDVLAGVEYTDCCWGMRFIARRQRTSLTSNQSPENSFYLEFVLNGLGNIGSDTGSMLSNIIPNYRSMSYEGKK